MTIQEISAEPKEDSFYESITSLSCDAANAVTERVSAVSNKVRSLHTEMWEKPWYRTTLNLITVGISTYVIWTQFLGPRLQQLHEKQMAETRETIAAIMKPADDAMKALKL